MANIDKWLPLFNAAKTGDEEVIKSILAKGAVSLEMQIFGDSALHVATYNGHENVVKLLCKKYGLIHIRDEKGRTPLFIAVSKGHLQIIEILCQNGSRVNARDREKNTPLLIAVARNHFEIVMLLMNHGANPTMDHGTKISPFQLALQKDYKPIVQIFESSINLLDICSCPTYPDPPFAEEIFNRCIEVQFAKDCVTGKHKRNSRTALHFAAFYGREYQVKKLIESGVNVNIQASVNLKTPLHEAVIKRQIGVIEYLITKMAKVNAVDGAGRTPIHYASERDKSCSLNLQQKDFDDSLKIMKILLCNGASVHIFDKSARTPLHYAVDENEFRPEKIRLLLEHKADVNASRNGHQTPIFFTKCGAILKMLIEQGADVNFKLFSGTLVTPLQFAVQEDDLERVEILLESGADILTPVPRRSFHVDDMSIVDILQSENSISEAIINRLVDITPVIQTLIKNRRDTNNIIPILAKRHFQGEVVINTKEFSLPSGVFYSRFKECLEELKSLRDIKIFNFYLIDILLMPIQKLRNYAKNEEIERFFGSARNLEKFRVYTGMMFRRHRKAKQERDLLESSSENLKNLIFSIHKIHLPDLIVHEIISLLHIVDWKNLAQI